MWRQRAAALTPLLGVALSLLLIATSAGLDGYLRRGGVWGDEVATLRPTTHALGATTALHLEIDRGKIDQTARLLRAGGFTYARQSFAWQEIEPRPGLFVDERTQRSTWEKYDYLVEALARERVQILALLDGSPSGASAPLPSDIDRYAAFAEQVVRRYQGKVVAVQVWDEPNVRRGEGGPAVDPAGYADLLRRTYAAVKAADPSVTVVAGGLVPAGGRDPGAENDLLFLEGLYQAGAKGSFDVLGVVVDGHGQSPDDRRAGLLEPVNLSRPVLTREVMLRHDDGLTPIWATAYGWSATPEAEETAPVAAGSVSDARQIQYLLRGLERMRDEWPWLGVVCFAAFRPVEGTTPAAGEGRATTLVTSDFTPRPAYWALAERAGLGAAPPGVYAADDVAISYEGAWQEQTLGGREYRLAGEDARLRLTFAGTRVSVIVRASLDGGRLYAALDGQPVAGLLSSGGRSYLSLRAERTGDATLLVASGLPPGVHTLELGAGAEGVVALAGLVVATERPSGWAWRWLQGAGLLMLWLTAWAAGRRALVRLGYLPRTPLPHPWRRRGRA